MGGVISFLLKRMYFMVYFFTSIIGINYSRGEKNENRITGS